MLTDDGVGRVRLRYKMTKFIVVIAIIAADIHEQRELIKLTNEVSFISFFVSFDNLLGYLYKPHQQYEHCILIDTIQTYYSKFG